MPLNEKVFDDQIRFVIKSGLKQRLYREAARRHISAADLPCRSAVEPEAEVPPLDARRQL